ncbi:MAG: tetratricopeptide repeat protein [Candidatus Brocadiae bacterium]|nr:tetratricopeptide repeat protein [Candidatus Brocadiia bacterium]
MAEAGTLSRLRELFEKEDLTVTQILEARRETYSSILNRSELVRIVEGKDLDLEKKLGESKGQTRRATGQWILGRTRDAAETLSHARPSKEALLVGAHAQLEAGDAAQALELADKLRAQDLPAPDALAVEVLRFEILEKLGRHEEVLAAIPKAQKAHGEQADLHCHAGMCCDLTGQYADAEKHYSRALELNPEHEPTLFRLAYNHDLRGEDKEALEVYERLRTMKPPRVASLINLGVMYEDRGDYMRASDCYEQVLDVYPNHQRAQLYYRDARASLSMYYDEDAKRREHRWGKLLSTPISEFQLSVRSRNCLTQINVLNLGDLVRRTEEELMTMRNFGETSLKEIKELLQQKGLRLARPGETGIDAANPPEIPSPLPTQGKPKEDVLQKPVAEFEWSARAKKALESLGVSVLADLTLRSEKELLGIKNFGTTSLNEIKQKLAQYGLSLKEG